MLPRPILNSPNFINVFSVPSLHLVQGRRCHFDEKNVFISSVDSKQWKHVRLVRVAWVRWFNSIYWPFNYPLRIRSFIEFSKKVAFPRLRNSNRRKLFTAPNDDLLSSADSTLRFQLKPLIIAVVSSSRNTFALFELPFVRREKEQKS